MKLPLRDRTQAGRELVEALREYAGRSDVVVLALPRGGVPVAYEIATAIGAPLDVILVRKLGAPLHPELAMGAIASGGVRVMNPEAAGFDFDEQIEAVARDEEEELHRRELEYRGSRTYPDLRDKCVLVVDDGLATGATMRAAISVARRHRAARIVAVAPVAPPDVVETLRHEADDVVCLATPEPFLAISRWYENFDQTSDDEVRALLEKARERS